MRYAKSLYRPVHEFPSEHKRKIEAAQLSARIARIRQYAAEEMDSTESKRLYRMADDLAQKSLPLKKPSRKREQMKLWTILIFLISSSLLAQLPPYKTTDFRTVTNTANGITSIPLCGSDARGVFFNSSDQSAGSCIDGSASQPAWLLQGSQLYVPIGSALTALRETTCYTAAFQSGCVTLGLQVCGLAKRWQVFHVPDMAYLGQSDTAGGVPTPVQKVSIVCPTPTPLPTTSKPPSSPTSTPVQSATRTPTLKPSSITTVSPTPSPFCVTPTPTPIPCGVVR